MIKAEPVVKVNEFRQAFVFDWHDVQYALLDAALKHADANFNKDDCHYEVELKEKLSPSYGYIAILRLTKIIK